MATAADISPKNLLAKLCETRYGEANQRFMEDLRNELYRFRRRTGTPQISRQAINNWFHNEGTPSRTAAMQFLSTYIRSIPRAELTTDLQNTLFEEMNEYFRMHDVMEHQRHVTSNISELFNAYFGARTRNVEFCQQLSGAYSLYFVSENFREHIVHGAMTFHYNPATNAFEVTEHQVFKDAGAIEQWTGFYFSRRNCIVMMLKGHGDSLDNLPKMYILNPLIDINKQVTRAAGRMIKIGTGGTAGICARRVLIKRDPDAFSKCDVLHRLDVERDIISELAADFTNELSEDVEDPVLYHAGRAKPLAGRRRAKR